MEKERKGRKEGRKASMDGWMDASSLVECMVIVVVDVYCC